jgi:hypothetical protein
MTTEQKNALLSAMPAKMSSMKPMVMARMERIQDELHQFSEAIMPHCKGMNYQDSVVLFLLYKIAELEQENHFNAATSL